MEAKIVEMEKNLDVAKDRRDLLSEKKKELEEILNQTLKKKKEVLYKRILLVNKKQNFEKAITNKTKEASDVTQATQISQQKPELDESEISFERINELTKQLQEFTQFTENASQIRDQMRNTLAEKMAKVNELRAECEQMDQMVRDQISTRQKKQQDANAKLIALKAKKKALDDKTSTLTMEVQQQKIRFTKLTKDLENLNGKFGGYMAQFKQ